tara:strand:+ start:436 stop:1143 length:708 start_codon:yes stop_codon:yes gene_type:complete
MKAYPVTLMCKVMKVSRSGFYDHNVEKTDDTPAEKALKAWICSIFKEHRKKYGSNSSKEKVTRLADTRSGESCGLKAKACRRFKITTDSRHSFSIAPNVRDRQFNVNEPNKAWAADISYAWTLEGWLYLAIVMELFSRQIVGWAVSRRLKKQLALDALAMAYWRRKPNAGLIHHSDRGSQYAYCDYKDRLKQYGMIPSMSKKGDCWDNAPTERFFQSLKSERLSDYRSVYYKGCL